MQKERKTESIQQLRKNGFKSIEVFKFLFINQTGNVYNLNTGKYLKPNERNYIQFAGEYISIPKMILQTFAGQRYRAGQIEYRDGNKENLTPQNLKYKRLFEPTKINTLNIKGLYTSIRCYFEVEKRFRASDTLRTKIYLQAITEKRDFFTEKNGLKNYEVLKTYLSELTNTIDQTAKMNGLGYRDYSIMVNELINNLISDILTDLNEGKLKICSFIPKITKTEKVKIWNEHKTAF